MEDLGRGRRGRDRVARSGRMTRCLVGGGAGARSMTFRPFLPGPVDSMLSKLIDQLVPPLEKVQNFSGCTYVESTR
jgi:hypothetical protein